jgi:hypothetical protein
MCADSARSGRPPKPIEQRFTPNRWTVDEKTGCYLWAGKKNAKGYGRIKDSNGKEVMAHRVAFRLKTGVSIPDGFVVCHRCDTPSCVNPSHLFLGTQIDNLADMNAKGRARGNNQPKTRDRNGKFSI